MSTDTALPDAPPALAALTPEAAAARSVSYKTLAAAFAYPDDAFCAAFPDLAPERAALGAAYDRLFRASEIWLYGAEHRAENEFQRVQALADINGFYRAFGVQPHGDRPDALSNELEFMHLLIVKTDRARRRGAEEQVRLCEHAQGAFFRDHLYPAGQAIAAKLEAADCPPFYREAHEALHALLEAETTLLMGNLS